MAAIFILTKDRKQLARSTMAGNVFTMGRSKDCNLTLDEPLASREHVEVTLVDGRYWIRDCESTNGTLLNGVKLAGKQSLKDGDEIYVGATRIKFLVDNAALSEAAADDDPDKTRAAGQSNRDEKSGRKVNVRADRGQFQVKQRITEGPLEGALFQDWDGPLTMGRSLENHVVLVDDAASIKHAQIVQNGNDYILEDLKSSNGTFLNGIKVQQAKLADGQKIRIGGATLVFEIVDLHRKRKTLKISLITMAVICVAAVLIKVLQPPDIAGEHLAQAHKLMDDGDPAGAKAEYEAALQIDPARMAAKQGIEEAKGVIEARDLLKKAEDAAMAEDYDNARELCYRVLRNFPNNSQALELKAVIKSIEDAKLAFTSHNWIDAKHLLEKVHDTYPKSKLVSQRLDDVHREIQAQSDMTRAKDAVEYKQYDDAQALLQSIPTNSVYSNEAKQLLDSIVQNREISDHLTAARSDFQNGKIPESLTELDAGLRIAPDDPGLADFQKHVRSMENLVKALDSAGVDGDAGLDRLLAGADICQKIIDLEADPLNVFRTRAQTTQAGITDKLTRLAGQYAASAQEYIKNNQPKEAYQALQMAMKANPTDQAVESQRDALFEKIELATKECYLKGYGLEGAGQIKLAINAYQDAINAGVPGEKYFNLATEKVKKLTAP